MGWDWLTSATAPWWAAIASSVATFILGNMLSNKSARDQRADDMIERKNERDHAAAQQESQRAHDAAERERERKAEAQRAAEDHAAALAQEEAEATRRAQAEGTARRRALATDAIDAIGGLQAAVRSMTIEVDVFKLDSGVLANFIQCLNRLRLVENRPDLFSPDGITTELGRAKAHWRGANYSVRRAQMDDIGTALAAMATAIVDHFWGSDVSHP